MINVSVSQLVNQVDKSDFTLYAEWEDTCFKIMVLRTCTVPLSGEMHIENANYFLNHLEESFETYLEKTKDAFSGRNADIQFFLQDDTFTWKQQNILTRGEIAVHSLSNILILSDTLKRSLELYQKNQERTLALENENEQLNKANAKLITDVEEMINVKTTMEKDLYMKFLLLLNTKKKKIRELQQALDDQRALDTKKTTKSVYDKTTDDESEGSDVESKKHDTESSKLGKHKMDYESEQKVTPKSNKKNLERRTNFSSDEDTSPKPSTSKGNLTLQDIDMDEESEEDMFS